MGPLTSQESLKEGSLKALGIFIFYQSSYDPSFTASKYKYNALLICISNIYLNKEYTRHDTKNNYSSTNIQSQQVLIGFSFSLVKLNLFRLNCTGRRILLVGVICSAIKIAKSILVWIYNCNEFEECYSNIESSQYRNRIVKIKV